MNLSIDVIAGLCAAVLAIVWLVRLEGKVNGKADSGAVAVTVQQIAALEASAKVHESTKEEVIRLQEQIKHLTSVVEGWMRAQSGTSKPSRGRSVQVD